MMDDNSAAAVAFLLVAILFTSFVTLTRGDNNTSESVVITPSVPYNCECHCE